VPASTLDEAATTEVDDRAWRWTVRVLYTTLVAAELWILFDWWRETPGGQEALARCARQVERLKAKAQECEGCARRRAMLQSAINRMHWQATQIVEGEDVPTEPEP
jgi:hypothetical protein